MWDWIVQILFQALSSSSASRRLGLSIIILVVIIRLLLTLMMPQVHQVDCPHVQVLQPKLLEIQERYAADPQRQAEELQKFYSENKFNFGGCLPLLIQMRSILVALFNLARPWSLFGCS
ncbi:MAG: YidC/Oxa1 family membrane protein insertase [Collinsella intestinalis]